MRAAAGGHNNMKIFRDLRSLSSTCNLSEWRERARRTTDVLSLSVEAGLLSRLSVDEGSHAPRGTAGRSRKIKDQAAA